METHDWGILFAATFLIVGGYLGMTYPDDPARASGLLLNWLGFPRDVVKLGADADGVCFSSRVAFILGLAILVVATIARRL